jgi:hypothetical protein
VTRERPPKPPLQQTAAAILVSRRFTARSAAAAAELFGWVSMSQQLRIPQAGWRVSLYGLAELELRKD